MPSHHKHIILNYCIAAVWLINGLFCKVLNLVPRHQQIVATILGANHARTFTILIGLAETAMAIWIITSWWTRTNSITQIVVIATMNIVEFMLAPNLLLWGRANALFALLFILVIYYNGFQFNTKPRPST